MPIAFRCPFCGTALSVPDEMAGSAGTCHACGAALTAPPSPDGAPELLQPGNLNRAPLGTPDALAPTGEIVVADVLGEAGRILGANLGALLPMAVVVILGEVALAGAVPVARDMLSRSVLGALLSSRQLEMAAAAGGSLVSILLAPFLSSGPRFVVHRLLTAGEAGLRDMTRGAAQYAQLAIIEAVMMAPVILSDLWAAGAKGHDDPLNPAVWGAFLAGALGTVLMEMAFGPVAFEAVDRRCGALSAFRSSWRFIRGNRLRIGLISLAGLALSLATLIACCVGFAFALPFVTLTEAIIYRNLRGMTRS